MHLYIDESGKFDVVTDRVSVAGVCASARVPNGMIRRALQELCPGWPWPLHTAHLRLPLSLALASVAARRRDPTCRTPVDAEADVALDYLRNKSWRLNVLNRVLAELDADRWPAFGDIASLNVALEAAPGSEMSAVRDRLAIARDLLARSIVDVLNRIPGAWGVAAVEAIAGTAGAEYLRRKGDTLGRIVPSATHRYFGLLGPALVTADAVAEHRASASPAVHVASRPAHDMRGLFDDDVKSVARRYGYRGSDLRVVSMNRDASATLVLADFVANTVRRVRMGGGVPTGEALTAALGIPFETETNGIAVSHVAIVEASAT